MCIQHGKCKGIFQFQSIHCPVASDQWDCFQNVLEEHGGRELFLNYQSNTDIFVWILLLQPNKPSIDHQTNSVFVNDDFEDEILSCRIQLLHLLLAVRLIVSKKINDFLREIVRGKILFRWFDVNPSSLVYWYGCCRPSKFSRLRFCFCLWPGGNHTRACLWILLFL